MHSEKKASKINWLGALLIDKHNTQQLIIIFVTSELATHLAVFSTYRETHSPNLPTQDGKMNTVKITLSLLLFESSTVIDHKFEFKHYNVHKQFMQLS